VKPGRFCALRGEPEEGQLKAGMDFREPRYRREVFLRFYEFHLRYRSHPGCVYYLFDELGEGWTEEQKLWFAFINGNTQNPVTSWLIFQHHSNLDCLDPLEFCRWFTDHYEDLAFDTDRRFHKKSFLASVERYIGLVSKSGSQYRLFDGMCEPGAGDRKRFRSIWAGVNRDFISFGRLSTFSYLEYLRIMGLEVDCDSLFLDDMQGSKSHRNGLAKVCGRDDLDWHPSNPGFDGTYTLQLLSWLKAEGHALLAEARWRFKGCPFEHDVSYFTLESALCTYKSWHRLNRRYPNVYNDMLHDRIRNAEKKWGALPEFWRARAQALPAALRLEDNPKDPGVKPVKQNHYLHTGQVIMMDEGCGGWPCFRNDFNDEVRRKQR